MAKHREISTEPANADHPLWPAFTEEAVRQGITQNADDLGHHDDWMPAWDMFIAGANALMYYAGPRPT